MFSGVSGRFQKFFLETKEMHPYICCVNNDEQHKHTQMNNNSTPQMNGDINEFCSSTRRSFTKSQRIFNKTYNYEGNDTTAFLRNLESMLNDRYCTAVISEQFEAAKGVAAVGRTGAILLRPFAQDFPEAYAELVRSVNFLEMAIGDEARRCLEA